MVDHRTPSLVLMAAFAAVVLLLTTIDAGQHSHYFQLAAYKDLRCHGPKITRCNASIYPIMDYKEAAWFYHIPFKSCRPLYAAGGKHVCSANMDLPASREECERICGETCKLDDGSEGICTLDEYCKIKGSISSSERPCQSYNVKCCPKNPNTTDSNVKSRKQSLIKNHPLDQVELEQSDESLSPPEQDEMPSESLIETVGEKVVDDVMNWLPTEFELKGAIERMKRHHCRHHPEKCAYHRQKIVDKLLRKINYFGQKFGLGYGGSSSGYGDGLVAGHHNPHHHQHHAGHHKQGVQQYYDPIGSVGVVQKQIPIEYQREFSKETFHNEDPKDYQMYSAVPLVQLPHHVEYPTGHQNSYRKEFQIGFRKEY